ncbi:kinetochore protein spc7 [Podospora conica]|nr:kinetochore protein spc7 [Schizothecium conicum]
MSSNGDATLPATRRSRKSISGRLPSQKLGEQENATVDLGSTMGASRKKSRSKSMGPGSLDILKSGAGNRRASLAIPSRPPPRSILKPTIPLLPEIPPHNPQKSISGLTMSGTDDSTDSTGGTKIALRTEEEQQAAAREREERERVEMEKEIKDRREARRKSLANRRVSFAAEATLHTFHEVEDGPDSTTSTNSTRRGSSAPPPPEPAQPPSDPSEPPSTPPEHVQDAEAESPANQRDLHQKKRRRSSGAASLAYDDGGDVTLASTVYDSDLEHADGVTEIDGEEMTGESDSDSDDGTMMTVEAEEMTSASVASMRSAFSIESTGDLDENLRLASQLAARQRGDDDDEEEVIAGFAGWGRKPSVSAAPATAPPAPAATGEESDGDDMEMDMEMTSAVGAILSKHASLQQDQDDDEGEGEEMEMDMTMDMSMDVTKAIGGIISSNPKPQNRRKSVKPTSSAREDTTSFGDQTMEFTTAVGAIKRGRVSDISHFTVDSNEDMSMELTTAVGSLLPPTLAQNNNRGTRRQTIAADDDGASLMDMTVAVGRILPGDADEDIMDETMGMDMTMAVGGIIKSATAQETRSMAKKVMEMEVDEPDPSLTAPADIRSSPVRSPTKSPTRSPKRSPQRSQPSSAPDESAHPELAAFRGKGLRNSMPAAASPETKSVRGTPSASSPTRTPSRSASPPKTRTPVRSASPPKTQTPTQTKPAPAMMGSRSSSPVRSASPVKATPRSPLKMAKKLFHQDPSTGASTPRVVLTPQGRRLSGLGADRAGLGSPKVAQIFDRRESIGDAATSFVPNPTRRTVAFSNPRVMEAEIDRERQDEEERENRLRILQREADGPQDDTEPTLSLREMIQGLSPKKPVLRGRKSLHVGSARGVLGKRPAELDDDEAEDMGGVKRLKGHQGSPVKNVKLQSPPSKEETTTGRKTRAGLRNGENTTDIITPTTAASPEKTTTPKSQGRFKYVYDQPTNTMDFNHTATVNDLDMREDDDGERIHLQDFLNMTSIRFMELTTTKRRHTVAPSAPRGSSASDGKEDISLERCVVAGACTVPMLELYQHSCRELKKYISEGRRIVKEIETETFEENPPLFREYMEASPEFKVLMDNQFKNVKSHARLLSKAMWYEWRMKLQEGLREGLVRIAEGMDADDKVLKKQQDLLASVLPDMVKHFESLEREHEDLEEVARELEDCDPEELQNARKELVAMDKAIAERKRKMEELRGQIEVSQTSAESLTKQKQQYLEEIQEADKTREECRGWTSTEVSAIKARTDLLEKQHGWAITGISGTTLTMTYKREIELVFDISTFQQANAPQTSSAKNSPIELRYIANNREFKAIPSTPEKEFFLERALTHIRTLPQSSTSVNRLLEIVSTAWDKANTVAAQVRFVNLTFPTTVTRVSDGSIRVKSSLMLVPIKTRIEVGLVLESVEGEGVEVTVTPEARVVYGEGFNVKRMVDFLGGKVGEKVGNGGEKLWSDALVELHGKLLAKGLKAAAAQKE